MAPITRKGIFPAKRDGLSHGFELDEVRFKEDFTRPSFEKMKSCEFSVEEQSSESEDEPYVTTLNIPTTCKGKFGEILKPTELVVDLPPEKASCFDQQGEGKWKLGALDTTKPRAPIEHDDFSLSEEPPDVIESGHFHCDVEVSENEKALISTPEVKPKQKKKKKNVAVEKSPLPSGTNTKLGAKAIQKRQSIGKQKRNTHVILCVDTPKHYSEKKTKRQRNRQKTSHSTPSGNKCVDSGINSGSSCNSSGSGDAGSYSDNNSGSAGGAGGGGGGFYRKGGAGGGHGRDNSEEKNPFDIRDVSMEDEEEEDKDGDTKMSSKEDSSMDCGEGNEKVHSTPWETFPFQTQHVQHSAYCSSDSCARPLCNQMKKEMHHLSNNNCTGHCLRCNKILNLIKLHAKFCKRPCCRVYNCNKLRKENDLEVKAEPPPQVPPVYYSQPVVYARNLDGHVVFDNTGVQVETPFQENMSYMKGERVGNGGNAQVFKVHFHPSSPLSKLKPMVMKEPEEHNVMSRDECHVYKALEEHPNIVQHYIVAMKGQKGHAVIFMEECDKSLKDLLKERHGQVMDDEEALFYWAQVVDGTVYIHGKNIIHKDIKAQNILLSGRLGNGEYFRAKLADFDAARILESELTKPGLNPQGTKGFAAPEVMDKQPHGRSADVFSLGGLLMELKGITPKEDKLYSQVKQLTQTSPEIGHLVNCCMQMDPSLRPTATQLQEHLRGFVPAEL